MAGLVQIKGKVSDVLGIVLILSNYAVNSPKRGILAQEEKRRNPFEKKECTPTITTSEKQSHDDPQTVSDPLSITADYDPSVANSSLTPSKRSIPETVEELDSAQLSSTKIIRDIKLEK
ncbi:unnamed protein product [Vicia faba]|uniref:Uncharacterized protein n=1 Tax=Vicia faba TaxID=3906 RepID=A0AAV1AAV2_VICFA|nr:unnamed protein product [Vicia faba]